MKKTTINLKNADHKSFQYVIRAALKYDKIKWNPERVSNVKAFINKYNWKGINYTPKIND